MPRKERASRRGGALRAFVPSRMGNRVVLWALELLRALHRLRARFRRFSPPVGHERNGHYLENQWDYDTVPFGRSSVRRAGCEAIAAYNALLAVRGLSPPMDVLIAELQRDGMLLNGRWGASPRALGDLLTRRGLAAEFTADAARFQALSQRSRALLLTIYNDREDILRGLHTVCITREAGGYVAHNALYARPSPVYENVDTLIRELWHGRAKALCLTGVR